MMVLTNLLTNMLRLGVLVFALAVLSGCGGSVDGLELEPAHRELEALGLVHDQGFDAYFESYIDLNYQATLGGDADVLDLLVRGGLMQDGWQELVLRNLEGAKELVQTNWRAELPTGTERYEALFYELVENLEADAGFLDGIPEILEAADPVAATRQWDSEAVQLARDDALSDVPDSYHSVITDKCRNSPLYMIGLCVETNVDVIVNIVEQPPGEREQFGMWIQERASDPLGFGEDYTAVVMISEAGGGALVCLSYFSYNRRQQNLDLRLAGSFNDDGVLTVSTGVLTETAVVYERGGVERLSFLRGEFTRVSAPDPAVMDQYQYCT